MSKWAKEILELNRIVFLVTIHLQLCLLKVMWLKQLGKS